MKLRYIVVDYDTELKSTVREKTCELPDGNIIFVVADRFPLRGSVVPAGLTWTSARICTPMSCSLTEKLCCSWCRLRHRDWRQTLPLCESVVPGKLHR